MALWGILDNNVSKPKYLDRGQIVAVNVTDGGADYVSAPSVTISAPAAGTQATATATITDGVVTAVTITDPGAGYTSTDTITVTFGSGDAAATAVYHGAAYNDGHIFFVDREEAQQAENKAKGLLSPGWWLYRTYTDAQSTVRHKSELLIAIDVPTATSGDASDDATLVDRTIVISVQPTDQSVEEGETATFSVTAAATPTAALTYQWEKQEGGVGAWGAIVGATSASYTTPVTVLADDNGDKFRVVISSSGATSVTSNAATLTVTEAA
jgi:hypothetical protein